MKSVVNQFLWASGFNLDPTHQAHSGIGRGLKVEELHSGGGVARKEQILGNPETLEGDY